MRFQYQNLNDKPNHKQGSGFFYGRCWWYLSSHSRKEINMEWYIGRRYVGSFGFSLGCREGSWHISVHLFFCISLYLTLRIGIPTPTYKASIKNDDGSDLYLPADREFELELREWGVHFKLWGDGMGWRSANPWWVRGVSFHIDDFLLGRFVHSEELVEEGEILIPMPEGSYSAKIQMKYETWKRPRWFGKHIMRAHIDCPVGVPHEGKGENAWDCGEDATYGLTCPAKTIEEGIAAFVETVLRDRRKYGTPNRIIPILAPVNKVPQ